MFTNILIRMAIALTAAAIIITLTACGGGDPEETCEPFVGPVSASHPAPEGFCQPTT